jgi:hypothetical protein
MPCVCPQCASHAQTLGLAEPPASRAVLRKAFKTRAKLWHPDRFEGDPARRLEAEERFKCIQAAYTLLLEHCENPAEPLTETVAEDRVPDPFADPFAPHRRKAAETPSISFGGVPGCYTEPDFPAKALEIAWKHIREPDRAVALVDLSGHGSAVGDLSQYILFSLHGVFVRNAMNLVSLLWYDDLGELRFVDRRRHGRLGLWQRWLESLSGSEHKYSLEIRRHDGTLFYSIGDQTDDSVKKVIYNFLEQKRPRSH